MPLSRPIYRGTLAPLTKKGQDGGMITEHALLPVTPGREDEFERAFALAKGLIAAAPGFGGLTLSRGVENTSSYLLLVTWDSLEAHETGFRGSKAYAQWSALLHEFYEPEVQVDHYEQVASA